MVITIVILIILAVVAINLTFREGGLIERANYGKSETEKASAREQIELILTDAQMEKYLNKEEYNENEYLDDYIKGKNSKIYINGNIIGLNGYTFKLDRSVPKLGEYIGETGEIPEEVTVNRAETEGNIDIVFINENNAIIEKPDTPKIVEGMVPVKWDGSKWIKTTSTDPDWYNYANKEWANIVLTPTSGGNEGKDADGDEDVFNEDGSLNEDSNYSMLVWIPRYAYKITYYSSDGRTITGYSNSDGIVDANGKIQEGTERPSAIEIGDKYILHPAFNYGNSNENKLRGFWVGKFETSSTQGNSDNEEGDNTTNKTIQIKASSTSWRYIDTNNIYTVCTEINKVGNPYGLNTSDSVVDPHLIKNTEWGAVAYLSKSKYGKETEEVWINPNSNYITGQAGSSVSAGGTTSTTDYKSTNGQKASTSGNITGVYDMSGGANERTAAYIDNGNSNLTTYGSYLVNAEPKYKDVYSKGSTDDREANYEASAIKYGDVIYETSNAGIDSNAWYKDYTIYPSTDAPFFIRGGSTGNRTNAGVFYFYYTAGAVSQYSGFRLVLPVL